VDFLAPDDFFRLLLVTAFLTDFTALPTFLAVVFVADFSFFPAVMKIAP
jgi:hypothetical protein